MSAAIPSPIAERIEAAVLFLSNAATSAPRVGDTVPDFELPNAHGETIRLSHRLHDGPVVLTFYRGGWCPFCNIELRALETALPDFRAHGASLIAISPQAPERSVTLSEREQLTFDVLSDVDQNVIALYGLQWEVTGDLRQLYLNVFQMDLCEYTADHTWKLPIPATFVIDTARVARAVHVDADYRTRMDPASIIAALASIASHEDEQT